MNIAFESLQINDSERFDIPNEENERSSSSVNFNLLSNDYLRANVGVPLSIALTFVLVYRPDDPIEFLAKFLIDWSRETIRQGTIDEERRTALNLFAKQREETVEENQHNHKRRLIFEYDQRLFTSYQWNFHLDPRTDDEREPSMNFFNQGHDQMNLKVIDRFHIPVYIHSHETSTSIDNEDHEQLPRTTSLCGYFRQLNERIRRCDENNDDYSNILQ